MEGERRQTEPGGDLTGRLIGLAIEVHRNLGPGLLESTYEACLCFELAEHGITYERHVDLPVIYKGRKLDCGYHIDVVADRRVVIEIKSVGSLTPLHQAQMLTYLRLSGYELGLLINFNTVLLKDGLRRLISTPVSPAPPR